MKKNRIKCNDIILISIFLITAILFLVGYNLFFHKKGNYVQVTADGRLVENLPLDVDTTITIDGYNNGQNVGEQFLYGKVFQTVFAYGFAGFFCDG